MKTIRQKLPELKIGYPLERIAAPEEILFMDIETTGFTARSSCLYLIGCVYYKDGGFELIQWFSENYGEEQSVLTAFLAFSEDFHYLVHFNGNHFDIPYLEQKCSQYGIPCPLNRFEGIDLYQRIFPIKGFLKLPNAKQKTVEAYLGIEREDTFGGGELISVYHDYVKQPSDFAYHTLLLHNADDIQGMAKLLPILSYAELFQDGVRVVKVNANYYQDFNNDTRAEVVMKLSMPCPLPVSVSGYRDGCYFTALGKEASLKVPLIDGELKYFYTNHKDYYYLPAEDTALHKSVASFVDKEHRVQATAATCYTRKISSYLPEWEPLFLPVFKASHDAKETYFELTDDLKKNREAFARYASHIVHRIMSGK